MKQSILSQIILYRYRYILGYIIFVTLLVGAIAIGSLVTSELSLREQQSTVKSATLALSEPTASLVINAPYHALQKVTLHFFDVTSLGIKLPSLIIGTLTGIAILWLMRRWLMRPSIALFASLITISTSQFLAASSTGTPEILSLFWIVTTLICGLQLSRNSKSLAWILLLGVSVGLSLYTPLSAYLFVAIAFTAILHPHLRFLLKKLPKGNVFATIVIMGLILVPLAIAAFKDPSVLLTLIGWNDGLTIRNNALELIKDYFFFWQPHLTLSGPTPFFSLPILVLIIFGGLKLLSHHYTARSYSLALAIPILMIPAILQPQYSIILLVPMILLMAIGIETLLDEWYRLFPNNPYPRIAALVPFIILMIGIASLNINHYTDTYRHSPDLARFYTNDLRIARAVLSKYPNATIVATPLTKDFYHLLKRDYPNMNVTETITPATTYPIAITTGTGINVAERGVPDYLATDRYKDREPRFYVYIK